MYSIYYFEQKAAQKIPGSATPDPSARSKARDLMTARYRDRINNSILLLNEQARRTPSRVRSPEDASTLQNTTRKFNNEKPTYQSNELCDIVPSPKRSFHLRPREKSKEIQPNFKLRYFGNDRLEECVKTQRKVLDTSLDPYSTIKYLTKDYSGNEKSRFGGGKNVSGYYHYKVHFKTIESLALDLHSSIRNSNRKEIAKRHREESLGIRSRSINRSENISKEDILPISSDVLEKYGIWKEKYRNRTQILSK